MTRQFHKMHGLGNDFVILDARSDPVAIDAALAAALCDRRTGIGCDQLIRLSPSAVAEVRMDIWNPDGSVAEACGNASRCVVALTGAASIETDGGVIAGAADGEEVEVELVEPRFEWDSIPLADPVDTRPVPCGWGALEGGDAVNVGNPHIVFFVEALDAIPLETLGPVVEHDPIFPERVNVNVAEVVAGGLRLRTWERGAGATLACGTGACASAIAAIRRGLVGSPVKVTMPGGALTIGWAPGEKVRMRGSATHVFTGSIDLEAL
ncbi:diaminopimelate epimerase [Sphingomonas sp. ASV193]|uniref:diaminopimelate epimerase n=1 Tax=Sphingomonas sp. ASV193 TaxID=3144405 RepID=UPI0032E877CF